MGYWSDFSLSSFSLRVCVGTCCHSNVYWLFKIHVTGKHHWSRGTKHCLLHWSARVHIWHTIWQIHSGGVAVFSRILCVCVCLIFYRKNKKAKQFSSQALFWKMSWGNTKKRGIKGTEWAGWELHSTLDSYHFPLFSFIFFIYQGKEFLCLSQQPQSQLPQLCNLLSTGSHPRLIYVSAFCCQC